MHNYVSCQIITCGSKPISEELTHMELRKPHEQIAYVEEETRPFTG